MTLARRILLLLPLLALASCGIKGDLVRPKDVPAYEQDKINRQKRAI